MPKIHYVLSVLTCLLFSALTAGSIFAQDQPAKSEARRPSPPRAQILLLGTFHFQDAGADDYKPQFSVDVLSMPRQKEITEILTALAQFKPTRIAVEYPAESQAKLDDSYRKYRAGQLKLTAHEIHQLGFRLAEKLAHEKLFAIDAPARWYDTTVSTEVLIQHAQKQQQSELLKRGQEWHAYLDRLSEREDEMKTRMSIPEFLVFLNSREQLRLTLGRYLVGQIEVGGGGDYIGADMRTAWYNRNIRIFSNIQRMISQTGERVLVIIGQGHVPILQHLIENAPEYELVTVESQLNPRRKASR